MQLKKQEIMCEMEKAKARILKELNCVKRSIHTDFHDLLADYNRIDFEMKQLTAYFKAEIAKVTAEYSNLISLKFAEYNDMVVDKVEQLEILEREIELYFSNKSTELQSMQDTVQSLIERVEYVETNSVTTDELNAVKTELQNAINEWIESETLYFERVAGDITRLMDELDAIRTELDRTSELAAIVPDWSAAEGEPGHVLNRTHWSDKSEIVFDGTVDNKEQSTIDGNCYVKVHHSFIPIEKIIGCTLSTLDASFIIDSFNIDDGSEYFDCSFYTISDSNTPLVFVLDGELSFEGYTLNRGVWFIATEGVQVCSIIGEETIHKIDSKFLPSPDWNETDETKGTFIKNKPSVVQPDWLEDDESNPAYIKNKPTVAQSDWNEADEESVSYIKGRTHYLIGSNSYRLFGVAGWAYEPGETYSADLFISYEYPIKEAVRFYLYIDDVEHDLGYIAIPFTYEYLMSQKTAECVFYENTIDNIKVKLSFECVEGQTPKWAYYMENTDSITHKIGIDITVLDIEVKTLEPFYLSPNAYPGYVLTAGEKDTMEWKRPNVLTSPNGTDYILSVSDDGTLSATPLTTE